MAVELRPGQLTRVDSMLSGQQDLGAEEWLRRLEDEVSNTVTAFNKVVSIMGITLTNNKPQAASLRADMIMLQTHADKIEEIRSRIQEALEESKRTSSEITALGGVKMYKIEYATDTIAVVLGVVNNVMKTINLSATSNVGWAAFGLQMASQVLSKAGDRANTEKLEQEKMRTKLRELRSRLTILDRAKTMIKLFTLFEQIKSAEKAKKNKLVRRAVALCKEIPEEFQGDISPEQFAMQILAVSKENLANISPQTKLGKSLVKVIGKSSATAVISSQSNSNHFDSPITTSTETMNVKELLQQWNQASDQITLTMASVDAILSDAANRQEKISFGSTILTFEGQVKKLKRLIDRADQLITLQEQNTYCSTETRLWIRSTVETIITAGSSTSFALFNLINPRSVTLIWVSSAVTILGPALSKMNKLRMKEILNEEVDRQLLTKLKEGRSFISSIETIITTLQSVEAAQGNLTNEQYKQLLQTCRDTDPFKLSLGPLQAVPMTQADMVANVSLKERDNAVNAKLRQMRKKVKAENRVPPQSNDCSCSVSCCMNSQGITSSVRFSTSTPALSKNKTDDFSDDESDNDVLVSRTPPINDNSKTVSMAPAIPITKTIVTAGSDEDLLRIFMRQVADIADEHKSDATPGNLRKNTFSGQNSSRRDNNNNNAVLEIDEIEGDDMV